MLPSEKKSNLLSLERLINAVQELSLAKDIECVMRIVRSVAREITGADGATFVLRDGDQCFYADEDAVSPLWKGSRFPMRKCISGWVMQNKKSVVIGNIYADDRIPADIYRPTFVKSMAMVPIRTTDPIGAIGNYWADYHIPTEEEVGLLQSLANVTAVSLENIQTRNMLEERVMERTKELVESLHRERELNETKNSFVSMASHEFRTPLSAILSSASLAGKYTGGDQQDKRDKHLERIKSSVRNLIDILNDFLSVDKLEEGKVEIDKGDIDLVEFMEDIVTELDGMKKNDQVIRYSHLGRKHVVTDKKIIRNVMLNLLSNAIKYSEKDVDLKSEVSNGKMRITVRDKGIGIPDDQQENVFGRFFRASNASAVQGTGLGLNIVRHYVSLLSGSITFTSKQDKGTTFIVEFPDEPLQ